MKINPTSPVFCAKHKVVYENIQKELKPIKKELDNMAQNNHVDLHITKSKDDVFMPNVSAYMVKASRNSKNGIETLTILKSREDKWLCKEILDKTKLAISTVMAESELTKGEKFITMMRSLLF